MDEGLPGTRVDEGTPEGAPESSHDPGAVEDRPSPFLDESPLTDQAPTQPDATWWSDVDRRHRALKRIGIGIGIGVAAVAVGAAVAVIGPRLSGTDGAQPSQPVTQAPVPAPGVSTVSPEPTSTTTSTPGATPTVPTTSSAVPIVRAPVVAVRRDGAVWTCDEAGGNLHRLVASAGGPFSLSPDGRTLALVDAASRTLTLVDAASGAVTVVGTALLESPAWSADSSFVVYSAQATTGHDAVVKRVGATGSPRSTVGGGASPRVVPDGRIVAVSTDRATGGVPVVVLGASGSKLVGTHIVANAVYATSDLIAYCDAGSPGVGSAVRQPSIGVMHLDGSGQKTLVKRPLAGGSAFFGDVLVSPDSRRLVYAESGDDGYSRVFTVPVSGGVATQLSTRRDGYLVGFSADGAELFYVDGNALQGEATRLMAVHLDGTGRRVVLEGAGL